MNLLGNKQYQFILGDCLSEMKKFPDNSVQCIITSPPYWAMRIYDGNDNPNEVGNEHSFKEYVKNLSEIFSEAKRILKKEGSLWLNLGDKYSNKSLMGMPWRVALSLIDDGWILRNDVIWNQLKGTQSCKDRLRDSYEHIFHFVKSPKYYYNGDAIRIKPKKEAKVTETSTVSATGVSGVKYRKQILGSTLLTEEEKRNALSALDETLQEIRTGEVNDFRMTIRGVQRVWHSDNSNVSGRAKELETKGFYIMKIRSKGFLPTDIWNIVTEDINRKDSHCAVFPEQLLVTPILATTKENDVILDPFSGTGSTVAAAVKLNRRGIGIDLSSVYTSVANDRLKSILL